MKQGCICVALLICAIAAPGAQERGGSPTTVRVVGFETGQDPTRRIAVESRVTRGAPYSADAITEFTQTLGDGNRITRKTITRNFRDSEGRTRREQTTAGQGGVDRTTITIVDPVAGTSAVLDPETRTASRRMSISSRPRVSPPEPAPSGPGARGGGAGGRGGRIGVDMTAVSPVPPPGAVERTNAGNSTSSTENLGQQTIEGVLAEGTRTTTMIPAGAIGNAQPIRIVSESWFSADLDLLVMTRHSDPRTGETTYRLTNIIRGEQDRALFEVPADYTIKSSEIRSIIR